MNMKSSRKKIFKNPYWYNLFTSHQEFSFLEPSEFSSWKMILGNEAPLNVEIGCGQDDSILKRAQFSQDQNFIGIENQAQFLRKTAKKLLRLGLKNVCLMNMDGIFALKYFFKTDKVQRFWMNFPDPWPKERHQFRRLFQYPCFQLICNRLKVGGEFLIKSDFYDAVELAHQILNNFNEMESLYGSDVQNALSTQFDTKYEKKYRLEGREIFQGIWTKQHNFNNQYKNFIEKIGPMTV